MATKSVKAAAKETVLSNVKPAKAPKPAFVQYVTPLPQEARRQITGVRPSMPTIPGQCFFKIPQDQAEQFEASREFQGGIVVRVDD